LNKISTYAIDRSTRYLTDLQAKIRKVSGNPTALLDIEKKMVKVLQDRDATVEGKKLILKELAWMGSDYCKSAVQELLKNADLKEMAAFALERMKGPRKI
jgi:hypothetical protein